MPNYPSVTTHASRGLQMSSDKCANNLCLHFGFWPAFFAAFASCLRLAHLSLVPVTCYLHPYPLQVRRIQNDGYNVERHSVTTKDGYVLTLHRIPQVDPESGSLLRRPAVFLLSGLYASSDVYVCPLLIDTSAGGRYPET